jgi:hypothetical protein
MAGGLYALAAELARALLPELERPGITSAEGIGADMVLAHCVTV